MWMGVLMNVCLCVSRYMNEVRKFEINKKLIMCVYVCVCVRVCVCECVNMCVCLCLC